MSGPDSQTTAPKKEAPKSDSKTTAPIQVDQITLRKLFGLTQRLTLSSIVFLVGLGVSVVSAAFWLGQVSGGGDASSKLEDRNTEIASLKAQRGKLRGEALNRDRTIAGLQNQLKADNAFRNEIAGRFANPNILGAIYRSISEENPDGLSGRDAIVGSLLWQLRSQRGEATFLSGVRRLTVKVTLKGDEIHFAWQRGKNVVPKILADHGFTRDADRLKAINTSINTAGFAVLGSKAYLLRTADNGLRLIKP